MPKSSASASEQLQDAVSGAVTTFLKAANHALASTEEANKEELRRALQDVRDAQRDRDEARRERDRLVQEKLAVAIDLDAAKADAERWKAATEKTEWMISHQAETITQLRLEAQQWKDQFVRVNEERLRLSARNDELVSQQLYANRRDNYYHEPLTPRSQGPQAQGSSSTRAASSNQHPSSSVVASGYMTDGDVLSRRVQQDQQYAQQSRITSSRTAGRQAKPQPVASSSRRMSQPQPSITPGKVLRTVHVVMQGAPVKEESLDSVSLASGASGSDSLGEDEAPTMEQVEPLPPVQSQRRASGKQKASAQSQSTRRRWSEGRRIYDDESESASPSASEDEYVPRPSKSRIHEDNDDEDVDELMLGGEADRHENYGPQRVLVSDNRTPARRTQTLTTKKTNTSSGSVRKRNSPYVTNGAGKKPRNR